MSHSKLSLFIITYNRCELLKRTLSYLASSPLCNYCITVLDNASNDNTSQTVLEFSGQLPNLTIITNKVNVGPNANFLKAFEYSASEYTWVLCDDDVFDLTKFSDVLDVIEKGEVDLIHVGAHKQNIWLFGGEYKTPRDLQKGGYPFFKFSSFMPCNIYKTKKFNKEYLVQAYNNIGNSYPHMPYAFGIYKANELVYIAKNQIVVADIGGQSYTPKDWFVWWMKTCELLVNKEEVRAAYLEQWKNNDYRNDALGIESVLDAKKMSNNSKYTRRFIEDYFTPMDKMRILYTKLIFFIHR